MLISLAIESNQPNNDPVAVMVSWQPGFIIPIRDQAILLTVISNRVAIYGWQCSGATICKNIDVVVKRS